MPSATLQTAQEAEGKEAAMAATMSKMERDQRQVLATNLELLVGLKVLAILNIVRRIKKSRAHGLNRLVTLNVGVGGDRNLRDLLKFRPDEKVDMASAIYQFLLQDDRVKYIEEQLLPRISDEDLTTMLEGWMSEKMEVEHRLTYDQIANSFDVEELWASMCHGLAMLGFLETHNMPCGVAPRDLQPAQEGAETGDQPADGEVIVEDLGEDTDGSPTDGKPTDSPDGK